ncbi:flagellar biosynthesis protein FliQ [Psychrosphaera sp. B3R10]|uniref:Flagellar biosynthetic protein FliQ n=1 Tax=Psychrosphaera algicola TaxID=3023714 RepID=A0ABT5FB09_9GAMM|nr:MULTISPECIES: flagellar biosynthesis protein FliQ [unclassified Psychrosphaera]MBU2884088.1 flagellar biosynthesis protein FliQ [Psychrosphaera sp. I2R16]MBU2988218.1 flagellar biosynthesis protein FliQ [Psychrosphaera sp. B3R10]MDC2888319.1 flagellar biosynthesis protein FliQ [Psychrosphaera sp. G1-22]MDO6718427.1 flagellar biosynthesis protein FliQ [Psychrosphaera sp. 1_MG-2023]
MSPEVFVDILREALWLIILLVASIVVPSLLVGLMVAIFQAATSINEQTLSFLPRLIVTLLALMYSGHWIIGKIMDFTFELINRIPSVIG